MSAKYSKLSFLLLSQRVASGLFLILIISVLHVALFLRRHRCSAYGFLNISVHSSPFLICKKNVQCSLLDLYDQVVKHSFISIKKKYFLFLNTLSVFQKAEFTITMPFRKQFFLGKSRASSLLLVKIKKQMFSY